MGITQLSIDRVNRFLPKERNGLAMMELGAQCLYTNTNLSSIEKIYWAKDHFASQGIEHTSIDLEPDGEWAKGGRAETADLSKPIDAYGQFDVVTNFGTSEHVGKSKKDLYECYKNIHNFCKIGGIIICENPKAGNWPGHGAHYVTIKFYEKLAQLAGYEILELTEEAAMGNTTNGWNVCSVLQKGKTKFISYRQFCGLEFHKK